MDLEVFARCESSLGEGPLWHTQRQSLFWLDINKQQLFEKAFTSTNKSFDQSWKLSEIGSALAIDEIDNTCLWMITDRSFGRFSIETGLYESVIKLDISSDMRSNDGGIAPDGSFWFGTMEKNPTGLHGSIYMISQNGELSKSLQHIGIPNTFCWSRDGASFFLSDSYRNKMFSYRTSEGKISEPRTAQPFIDLSKDDISPDGGAIDQLGNIWNSQWDGFRVTCYSPQGDIIDLINLPIPRPTSCCFGGPDNHHLFITSAKEGLSSKKLIQYPLSGSVLMVELPVKGQPILPFAMKG